MLGQLGEADVAVVGAVEQRTDRRSLEEDGGIVLGMQRSAAQRLHVQGPGESLVEHADRLARMPMVRIVNGMAVAIASNLGIHVGGKPLFDDVSFKLERRDRMTLSGRNGAGKSTLLRVLAGELTPDSGGVVLEKGARVALHDQRPPRDADDVARRLRLLRPRRRDRARGASSSGSRGRCPTATTRPRR